MNVIIAGGGTGGHLFPGIAVAREIQRRQPGSKILFVGAEQGIETRIVPKEGFELRTLPVGGIKGLGVARQIRNLIGMLSGVFKARQILRDFRPDVVVGVGGYASFPMLSAATLGGCRQVGQLRRRYRSSHPIVFRPACGCNRQSDPSGIQIDPRKIPCRSIHDFDFRWKPGRAGDQSRRP
jgi:UDP:flavonoid glycosyltransferase YjiC (YdhE family)